VVCLPDGRDDCQVAAVRAAGGPQTESTSTEIEPVVTMKGGKLIADSRDVAEFFGRQPAAVGFARCRVSVS
jgi:hypothetical protein